MENKPLPDFMKFKDSYSANGFVEKIGHIAKRAGAAFPASFSILSSKLSISDLKLLNPLFSIASITSCTVIFDFPLLLQISFALCRYMSLTSLRCRE